MAVSEAFLKAGRVKAKAHAIRLIFTHVPKLCDPATGADARRAAGRGLDYARMLGRQHGFEDDVRNAIQAGFGALEKPSPVAAELQLISELSAPKAAPEPACAQMLEAAE
jgi:hypothetical protein